MILEAYSDPEGVIWLAGELDLASAEEFRKVARSSLDGQREVVLDLSRLDFIDSSGIRAILKLAEEVGERGVVLRNPRPSVRRPIDMVDIVGRRGIRLESDD